MRAAKKQSQIKPKQSQSPAFGGKFEALSSKSEKYGWVPDEKAQFEKTKPILELPDLRKLFENKII